VQLQHGRGGGVDQLAEPQGLLVAVPPVKLGDHRAAGHLQGANRLVVPLRVVVRHEGRRGRQHWQASGGKLTYTVTVQAGTGKALLLLLARDRVRDQRSQPAQQHHRRSRR
jgi:hypothetical protein